MNILKVCEICKGKRLWFQVKQREMKPVPQMPKVKSEKKMCSNCFNKAKKYFTTEIGEGQIIADVWKPFINLLKHGKRNTRTVE